MKIAYQGIPGSYSESACLQYLKTIGAASAEVELKGMDSFQESVQALLTQEVDLSIMPIENSTTGLITRTLDLFRYQPLIGRAEVYERVQHTLWGVEGARVEELREVYSHPEALSQCQSFFDAHPHIQPISYVDTAQSAQYVKDMNDPQKASLSSPRAGELYDLKPLMKQIQSEKTNTTRFFVMERLADQQEEGELLRELKVKSPERTRMMLYVETAHKPGALAKLLNTFDLFDCNLEALDARPIRDKPFNYGFFIEVDLGSLAIDPHVFWQTLTYSSEHIQIIAFFKPEPVLMNVL